MSKVRHIPRRTGVGARQVIAPKVEKAKRSRVRPGPPMICGEPHPDLDIVCGASSIDQRGFPIHHRGKHRARPLAGVTYRWAVSA